MSESKRFFCQNNTETDVMEWFFNARENVYGPFFSEEQAITALEAFIQFNIEFSDDGGRSLRESPLIQKP